MNFKNLWDNRIDTKVLSLIISKCTNFIKKNFTIIQTLNAYKNKLCVMIFKNIGRLSK